MAVSKRIDLGETPRKDIKDGLLVLFDKDLPDFHRISTCDINALQRYYPYPPTDGRKIAGFYKKIK